MKKTKKEAKSPVNKEAGGEEDIKKAEENKEDSSSITEMNDFLVDQYLFELSNTKYWQAILHYNRKRDAELLTSLVGNDPFAQPTLMARNQGERTGIYSLEKRVEYLKEKNREFNKTKEEKAKEERSEPSYSNW